MSNKLMILVSVVVLAIWAGVHLIVVRGNLEQAADLESKAESERTKWKKFFASDPGFVAKPEAEQNVRDSNTRLNQQLQELQKLEFATPAALAKFSLKSASGDKGNYLIKRRDEIKNAANDTYHVKLGEEKRKQDSEDNIGLNLLRLAFAESVLTACKSAGIPEVKSIFYEDPVVLKEGQEAEAAPKRETRSSRGKAEKAAPKSDPQQVLVQFPLKATFVAPERAFAQLLYELQKPTDGVQGHFNVRGINIDLGDATAARHAKDGNIVATVVLVPVLSVKTVQEIGVEFKALEEAEKPPEADSDRGGFDSPE
jgi:hypothetical protein